MPALQGIGRSWGENAMISANEHFTSEIVRREVAAALVTAAVPAETRPAILLACPEDERHEIGLLALSLLLRLRGLRTVYLGADVPTSDLLSAIQGTSPSAVCLSATTRSGLASLGRAARTLVSARLPVPVFAGGPAFRNGPPDDVIAGVILPQSLEAAVSVVAGAVEGR
jgi:methanogenic corrinoid protein MtbC1